MDLRLIFDEDARNYDRYRPPYVPELFQDIIDYAGLGPGMRALEIGIGTGQATEPILRTGCQVDAIELGQNLAAYAAAKFAAYPGLRVVQGDFRDVSVERSAYDLVYCATAFHWLPEETGFAGSRRSLKPGGAIALFWNHPAPDREDDPAHVAHQRVFAKYHPSDGKPRKAFGEGDGDKYRRLLGQHGFTDVDVRLYHGTRTFSPEDYVGLLNTYSDHRALPQDLKAAFDEEMRQALYDAGGSITIHDTMDLYLARRP